MCGLSAVSRAALRCSVRASHAVLSLAAEAVTSVTTAQAAGARASVGVACGLSYPAACGILVPGQELNPKSPALAGEFLTSGPESLKMLSVWEDFACQAIHIVV